MVLKKEIVKTQSSSSDMGDRGPEYRQMLVGAIHACAVKFPDVRGRGPLISGEGASQSFLFLDRMTGSCVMHHAPTGSKCK